MMAMDADCEPILRGLKVTSILQLLPGPIVAGANGQFETKPKSPSPAIDWIVSAALPLLVSTDCLLALVVPTPCEPKLSVGGFSVTLDTGAAVPLPDRVIECGEPVASVLIEILPGRLPAALGVKVMLTVQD